MLRAMAQAIDLSQPLREQTRTELSLTRLGSEWSMQPRGRAFTEGLVDFLRGHANEHTLRSYSFSVLEFFGHYERDHRRVPTPDLIRRGDAIAFESWLRERRYGLREYHLEIDPERGLDAAIYAVVKAAPGSRIDVIREQLLGQPALVTMRVGEDGRRERVLSVDLAPGGLGKRLACLVELHTLKRTPSIAQIRRSEVDVGLPPEVAARVGLDFDVPERVFRYFVPEYDDDPAERASTIVTRLSALASLWDYFRQTGDNVSTEPLLRVNIWTPLLRAAQKQAPTHQKARRADKTPSLTLFEQLLAATFRRRYGDQAEQMAQALMRPSAVAAPPPRSGRRETYADLRDRALLLLMGQTGVRSEEVQRLRRADVAGQPPLMTVRGKGGRKRQLRVPPATVAALRDLTAKLEKMAAHQARYHPERQRARLLLEPDAPLLPAVAQWGANAGTGVRGLSRPAIAMMLRRRAIAAGISPGTSAFSRIHPHGLRHLFAKTAMASGTPVNVVQAMLGHQRGSTTLRYMEEHEPQALIARGFEAMPEPERVQLAPPLPPAEPQPPAAVASAAPPPPRIPEPEPVVMPTIEIEAEPAPPEPPAPLPEPSPPPEPRTAPAPLPEPQPAPPLVAVGAEPDMPPDLDASEEESFVRLERIYEARWGEKGQRSKLMLTSGEREVEAVGIELAAIVGIELGEVEPEATDRLVHAYVGDDSGLVWWAGPTGRLSPNMPVMSPSQAGECTPEAEVCQSLAQLWQTWASGQGRGPTGASALLLWIAEALEVAVQVAAEVTGRDGGWVRPLAPWEDTSEEGEPKQTFREHEPGAVVSWFEQVAWQHRRYRTRGQRVIDTPLDVPAFYADADPVASLDDSERDELLDWIAALSGQQPRDVRSRFGRGASRADLARLLEAMCRYDEQKAGVRETEPGSFERSAVERAARRAAESVDNTVRTLGGPADYDFVARVSERAARRRGATDDKVYERRQAFYLRQLEELFGAEAGTDPALRLVALCGQVPLADPRFRELFQIDWLARTIRHDRPYMRRFAEQTGMHSECVGRRLARELWELHKKHLAGDRQRLLTRPDELVDYVEALRAYRVPCPEALERDLASLLGTYDTLPVYEAWEAARTGATEGLTLRQREIAEELSAMREAYAGEIGAEFERDIFRENPGSAAVLPSPIELLAAVIVR